MPVDRSASSTPSATMAARGGVLLLNVLILAVTAAICGSSVLFGAHGSSAGASVENSEAERFFHRDSSSEVVVRKLPTNRGDTIHVGDPGSLTRNDAEGPNLGMDVLLTSGEDSTTHGEPPSTQDPEDVGLGSFAYYPEIMFFRPH